jgi:hypothetical protein
MTLPRPFEGKRLRRPEITKRVNWPRLAGVALVLAMWPAIAFVVSRFF